jgi:general secretion pathway protein A
MYKQYFGLTEAPFSIAPDPRYLFLSDKHREALAHLIYGVGDQGGFVVLTGEVGTGKTTICRCLLQQIPENADIAFIINPKQSINQLLQSIFKDLRIPFEQGASSKDLIDRLNDYLLAAHARGRNTILIIDEAQNLTPDVLEQLRLLTNLETNEKKLLQLVLLGQPELNDILAMPELRQLAQRVTARYHLSPLSKAEVIEYIEHRLSVAGCRSELFPRSAINKIYRLSKGVPRLINLICDRSLLGIYATNSDRASPTIIRNAAKEIFPMQAKSRWRPVWLSLIVSAVILVANFSGLIPAIFDDTLQADNSDTHHSPTQDTSTQWQAALLKQRDLRHSLEELYSLWLAEVDTNDVDNCLKHSAAQNHQHSLYCINSINSIEQLRHYNRPAVLAITTQADQQAYMLIKSLSSSEALVVIAGREYRIEAEQLKSLDLHAIYLLSRIPGHFEWPVQPGSSGASIAWLQTLISDYSGAPLVNSEQGRAVLAQDTDTLKNKYDFLYAHYLDFNAAEHSAHYSTAMQKQVEQLQRELGFEVNGVVDIAFIAALQQKINTSDPVLFADKLLARNNLQEG